MVWLPGGRCGVGSAAAAAAGALLLTGCRAHVPAPPKEVAIEGASLELPPRPVYSDPKPPEDDKQSAPGPAPAAARAAPKKDPLLSKKGAAPRAEKDAADEEAPDQAALVLRGTATAAAVSGGERPDAGDQEGRPLARRPDEGEVIPPGPPLRYLSPAPLRAMKTTRRSPGAADDAPDDLDADPKTSGTARRPGRAPATGLMLDDSIPETGIGDPEQVGSYHVQIASSPDFSKVLFDKVYPFMGEVDLYKDLRGAPSSLRTVWIRWSLVDLLDYEHPFSRPKRLRLARGRGDGL